MPDIRKHRGAHPEDRKLFADDQLPALRTAVRELSWLLSRDYSIKAALKLVGDRHALAERIRDLATENGWNWTVEVLFNPDAEIIISGRLVISSDSHILDKTDHWINFNRYLLDERLKKFWLIDLSG